MLKLKLLWDSDVECPNDWDGWKLYSFSRKHKSYKHPDEFFPASIGLRRKIEVGTAFVLSYFEHGNCVWSLRGDGPQCHWDNVEVAGILVWEQPVKNLGPKKFEDRRKDAAQFLQTYTAWYNGEGAGYVIEDEDGEHVDSCFGFLGPDFEYMAEQVRSALDGKPVELVESEAKCLADSYNFGQQT